jgi:hypothetical protein
MILFLIFIVLVFIALAFAIAPGSGKFSDDKAVELVATLFSSATFSLFLIAAAIGALTLVLTLYGREWLEKHIDAKVEEKLKSESMNLSAISSGYVGYIFGTLYHQHQNQFPELLDLARIYSKTAVDRFKDDHPSKMVAKNNFAFFTALQGRRHYGQLCAEYAKELRQEFMHRSDNEYVLTYAAVVAAYKDYFPNPDSALEDATQLMKEVASSEEATLQDHRRAKERLEQLQAARDQLSLF